MLTVHGFPLAALESTHKRLVAELEEKRSNVAQASNDLSKLHSLKGELKEAEKLLREERSRTDQFLKEQGKHTK